MERYGRLPETVDKQGTELGDVVKDLLEKGQTDGLKSITIAPREYRIRKPITPESLESLSVLPFEVLLSEHDAGTTLVTGAARQAPTEKDIHTDDRSQCEARYTLHNHPNTVAASPSDGDLKSSRTSKTDIDFIVAWDGITVHKLLSGSNVYIADRYWSMPIAALRGRGHAVEDDIAHGLVDAWIPWGDPRVQEICDYLNGKVEWNDIKERVH